MTTFKDIAAAAGVSVATVSRVLNEYPHVRPAIRDRVQAAVVALGYQRQGAGWRGARSRIVGVFLRQQRTPFSSALGAAIEERLLAEDYRVLICSTNGDPDREEHYVQAMLEMRAEGVIIRPTASWTRTDQHVKLFLQAGIPVVFVDMKPELAMVSAVHCDNFSGGHEGIRHLVELGHRRIGVIAGRGRQATGFYGTGNAGIERVRGILHAAKDLVAGVELVFTEPFDEASVERGIIEGERLLRARPDLTAIFATTDVLAIGAMQAAQRLGYSVPGDLSVLGYDGIMESEITFPPLTTMRQPIAEMGSLAAEILLQHIAQPESPVRTVVLETTIQLRGSTAPAATGKRTDGGSASCPPAGAAD